MTNQLLNTGHESLITLCKKFLLIFRLPPRGFNPLSSHKNKGLKPLGGEIKNTTYFLNSSLISIHYSTNHHLPIPSMTHSRKLLFFFFLLNAATVFGQRLPGGGGGGFGSFGSGGGSRSGLVTRDTSEIYYFYADRPNEISPFKDSLLGNFHQYDPIRQQGFDQAHLGNLGSAHHPLFYQPTFRQGFDVGQHQFDLYQMQTSDIRYYKLTQAYTQAGYSQGPTQADAYTNLRFSRNFADGINLSLEHRRINNAGAFDNQKAVNSDVAVGLWYHNKYNTYDGFFSFVINSVEQQDNGGLASGEDTVFTDAFRLDVNLQEANTRHANKEYAYTQYFYLNKILSAESIKRRSAKRQSKKEAKEKRKEERRLAKLMAKDSSLVMPDSLRTVDSLKINTPKDSLSKKPANAPTKNNKRPTPQTNKQQPPPAGKRPTAPSKDKLPSTQRPAARPPNQEPRTKNQEPRTPPSLPEGRIFTLYHQIAWRTDSYKFSALPADSLFFNDFWVDKRGARHFLETKKLQNTVKLQTFKLRQSRPDSTGRSVPAESDLLEVGLLHSLNVVNQEPVDTANLQNLFLMGSFNFSPNDRIRIRTYGHLGIGANAGDFRLSGDLFLNFKKIGKLQLEAVNQLSTPSLLSHRFYISAQKIWENDFSKTLETSLKGTYSLPAFDFSISGQYHLVDNLVYFDTASIARQNSGVVSIFQLTIQKGFHAGPVHLENWLGIQESTSDVLRLPTFYSKHSLYFEGLIFKKAMLARFGVDARLTTGYTPYGYQPLTGQFHLQNSQALPFTPLVDAFLSFKVKTFRFFFKVENVLTFFTKEYYYQTAGYAQAFGYVNGGLRFGVNWRLVD